MTPFGESPRLLLLLVVVVGAVSCSTLAFAVSAVSLRLHAVRRENRRRRLEEVWEPLILDVIAGDRAADDVWRTVSTDNAMELVEFLLRIARRLRGEDIEALARIAAPYLTGVVKRLRHRSVEQRAFAVETLNVLGLGAFRQRIASALDDRAPLVAMIAARALARKGEPLHLEAILDHLHRFETWSPRLLASLLASVGSAGAPALRRALVDARRPVPVRSVVAAALQQLDDLEAAAPVVEVLESETDRDLLAGSLRLLARVGRPEQAGPVRTLCHSTDFVVRAHALTALARIGTADDAPILLAAVDDPSPWVAIHAANGLRIGGHLSHLRELAASDHPRAELARQVLSEAA